MDMRRSRAWLVAPLAWIALATGPATADCGPTTLMVSPASARVGEVVTLEGTRFSFCDDTTGPCEMFESTPTYETATVVLMDDRRIEGVELATANIEDGTFTVQAEIPRVPPGRYRLKPVVDGRPWDVGTVILRIVEP